MGFAWDKAKARSNATKHGVSFDEAVSAFRDPLAAVFADQEHSFEETRELLVGHSILGRLLFICFAEETPGVIRIISARLATRREVRDYEREVEGR